MSPSLQSTLSDQKSVHRSRSKSRRRRRTMTRSVGASVLKVFKSLLDAAQSGRNASDTHQAVLQQLRVANEVAREAEESRRVIASEYHAVVERQNLAMRNCHAAAKLLRLAERQRRDASAQLQHASEANGRLLVVAVEQLHSLPQWATDVEASVSHRSFKDDDRQHPQIHGATSDMSSERHDKLDPKVSRSISRQLTGGRKRDHRSVYRQQKIHQPHSRPRLKSSQSKRNSSKDRVMNKPMRTKRSRLPRARLSSYEKSALNFMTRKSTKPEDSTKLRAGVFARFITRWNEARVAEGKPKGTWAEAAVDWKQLSHEEKLKFDRTSSTS